MTKYEFAYDYDATFVASVSRENMWVEQGGWAISSLIVGGLAIAGLVTSSFVGFWSFCLGLTSWYWVSWLLAWRQLQKNTATTPSLTVSVVFDETGCTFNSSISHLWVAWSTIARLHSRKRAVVLERANGNYLIAIPADALTPEALKFLKQCIKQARVSQRKP